MLPASCWSYWIFTKRCCSHCCMLSGAYHSYLPSGCISGGPEPEAKGEFVFYCRQLMMTGTRERFSEYQWESLSALRKLLNGGVCMPGIARGQLWSQDAMISSQKVEFLRKWNFLKVWNLGLPGEPARTGNQRLQVSPWLEHCTSWKEGALATPSG